MNQQLKEKNAQNIIENNEMTNKENKEEQKKNIYKHIISILMHSVFCIGISFDFINYLLSPHVRINFII